MEQWVDIPGFPNYLVSDEGRIGNKRTGLVLKGGFTPDGYLQVNLRNNGFGFQKYVHILVAEAFLGPKPASYYQVNHINEPKSDNRAINLEWMTHGDNMRHAYSTGLIKNKKIKVRIIETGEEFESIVACANHLKVHKTYVGAHLKGKRKNVKGYHIEYI